MKLYTSLILLFLIPLQALGYYPIVDNYSKMQYKAKAQNWSIAQSPSGNIWTANSGILEFDGKEWSLTNTYNMTAVRSVYYDNDTKRLYFGASNEFGYLHFDEKHSMEYVSLIDSLKATVGEIWAIHKIGHTFYLRENNNVFSYDGKTCRKSAFDNKVTTSTVIDNVLYIYVSGRGILRMNPDTDTHFSELPGCNTLKHTKVSSIFKEDDSRIMIATESDGLYRYKNGILESAEPGLSKRLSKASVYCATSNGTHSAYGTVKDGVFIKANEDGTIMHLNIASGLQNNTVLSMMFDTNGDLWLGLDNGLSLVHLSSPEYNLLGDPRQYGTGYAAAKYQDELWIGTNQGLFHIPPGESPIPSVSGQVWDLQEIDGTLFCSYDKGLCLIKNGKTRMIPLNGCWRVERLKNSPQYILGSTYDRLFLLKKNGEKWVFDAWLSGHHDASKVFEEDNDGRIWFSHWVKGLFRLTLDVEEKKVTNIEFKSRHEGFPEDWGNIPMTIDNNIVFKTADGYFTYDNYTDRVVPMEKLNALFESGMPGASVYKVHKEDLYFSSEKIQALLYKDTDGRYIMDSLSLKGLISRRITGFEEIIDIDKDRILVNTDDGFSVINTSMIKKKEAKTGFKLFIKDISVLHSQGDSSIFSSRNDSICKATSLTIPFEDNSLRIKVSLPFYKFTDKIRYSFMLEGYDRDWSPYSEADYKEYTKIPQGEYIMKVKATSPDSDEDIITYVRLHILPPWYAGTPAIATYIILLIFILYLIYKWAEKITERRARKIQKQKELLMQEKQVRLELEHKAQDLAASTMNLIRKNEILLEINSELEKASDEIADDRNKSLKIIAKVRKEIQENIQHDDDWKKFEKNFDIVYDDFLKRLGNDFPKLTIADKKMCAYLKMGLCSKEIAPLLNITVRSVEMNRYRLRKKIGLEREDNLTEFLQKY